MPEGIRPKIFISSTFSSLQGGQGDVARFRRRLKDSESDLGAEIVLAEDDKAVNDAFERGDQIGILGGCVRIVSKCDGFVALVHARHGAQMTVSFGGIETQAAISIFESELLQACMNKIPSLLLRVRGFEPERPLAEFLDLVAPAFQQAMRTVDEMDVAAEIREFAGAVQARIAAPLDWIGDRLWSRRMQGQRRAEAIDPKLRFLNGGYRQIRRGDPHLAVVRRALESVRTGVDPSLGPVPQSARLSLLWMAIRELAQADDELRANELFEPWSDVLGAWNSNAAWYGLHGAHPMGCLATLNTIDEAHRTASGRRARPTGGRASAYYSCGGLAKSVELKKRYYLQALDLSETALLNTSGLDCAAGLGLRGSCRARVARLVNPALYLSALGDYSEALRLRERLGAGPMAVGDSIVELAFARGQAPFWRREALARIAEGLRMIMSAPDFEKDKGFYFRGRRKQVDLLLKAGQADEAYDIAVKSREEAQKAEMFDQARQFDEYIARARGIIGNPADR